MNNIYNSSENKNNILTCYVVPFTLLLGKGKVSDASLKAGYFLVLILVHIFC